MPELSPERAERSRRQVATWRATIDRWESEPPTQEGRKELIVRAKAVERERDTALAADNMFDFASASLQLAIVLASAAIVIGTAWLAWVAGGVGIVGIGFAALGGFAPTLITL
jgi:Domain of unknown function (DUF4337)